MKLRLFIFALECGLVLACLMCNLSKPLLFASLLLINLSLILHSGVTNLNAPIKKIENTTDFLIDNLDGGIIINFFVGLMLLSFKDVRIVGYMFFVSGVCFLVALRHIQEYRYQLEISRQKEIYRHSEVNNTPTLQEVEV